MSLSTTLSAIRAMSLEERIRLVQAVWDEIAAEQPAIALDDEFKAELDRRIAAYEADPSKAVPWEQVQAKVEQRLKQ
jgi:putative addiction module component (TIGR02574 family)